MGETESAKYPQTTRRPRVTRQSRLIREIFAGVPHPVSLTELHQFVVAKSPKVAYSTVFRWMQAMLLQRQAVPVEIRGQAPRYDVASRQSHCHLYCRRCDNLIRIDDSAVELKPIPPSIGTIEDFSTVLYGSCVKCAPVRDPKDSGCE